MKTIGLIVNPLAGLGGRVGLKGSDGAEIRKKAFELGAIPQSASRTVEALNLLKGLECVIVTYPGDMGEDEAVEAGLSPVVIGTRNIATSAEDTMKAAGLIHGYGVDLIVFAGGDGTARDIYSVVGDDVPVMGIPTGVKIHSGVYAVSPVAAGRLLRHYVEGGLVEYRLSEVMDIDEEAFRENTLSARLYGYMKTLYIEEFIQGSKESSRGTDTSSLLGVAHEIAEEMEDETLYVLGPGTSVKPIADELGLEKTLLGVDVVKGKLLIARDVNEAQLLAILEHPVKLVVSVIGGQGFVFGRGNQQLSPAVIRKIGKPNIIIVASPPKLAALARRPLRVDTGDAALDEALKGYYKVYTGYGRRTIYKVA